MRTTAVILLNWNGRKLLEQYLPSVVAFSGAARIVVADNGSTDNSVAFVKERYPSVELLEFDRNYGFAEGYNKAVTAMDADFVVLLNTDVEVTEGWLDEPLKLLAEDDAVAAVQPKIRSFRNKQQFEYAGAAGGFIDRWGFPFCQGRVLGTVEEDKGQYNNPREVFWATGACMFARRAAYLEAGGFDPLFFAHQEEIDLCWRWKNRGYKLLYTPESTVYHLGAATLNVANPKKTYLNFRNNRLMLYKNLSRSEARRVFFVRFLFDAAAWLVFVLSGKWGDAKAMVKAYIDFEKVKRRYKLDCEQPKKPFASYPEVYRHSIVWNYYAKGKRRFSELAI